MTVASDRTIDNSLDVGRKIPVSALSGQVLLELEGATIEQLTGPGPNASVALSRAAATLVFILAHDGAGALEAGGVSPAALAVPPLPADFAVTGDQLDNLTARDYSGSTLLVIYQADVPAEQVGGQSTVTP
jgi:hypothetical protein